MSDRLEALCRRLTFILVGIAVAVSARAEELQLGIESQFVYNSNFVSSSKARLEQAAQKWREGAFPVVPGDEHERAKMPA